MRNLAETQAYSLFDHIFVHNVRAMSITPQRVALYAFARDRYHEAETLAFGPAYHHDGQEIMLEIVEINPIDRF